MRQLICIACLAFAFHCGAQEITEPTFALPRNLIKLSPLQLFTNTLEIGVESFNSSFSKSFQASVGFRSGGLEYNKSKGVSLELAYRKYVLPMKFNTRKHRGFYQGIYYSVFVQGAYFKGTEHYGYYPNPGTGVTTGDFEQTIRSISPGFTLGLQKTLWKVVFLDVYVGGGLRFSDIDAPNVSQYVDYTITDPGYEGIYPKIGAKIGVGL
jgi:hypothetical protein